MLFSYRKKCASNSSAGQLILPEALRLLPLYTLCAHKMLALRPNSQVWSCSAREHAAFASRCGCGAPPPTHPLTQSTNPLLYVHRLASAVCLDKNAWGGDVT